MSRIDWSLVGWLIVIVTSYVTLVWGEGILYPHFEKQTYCRMQCATCKEDK